MLNIDRYIITLLLLGSFLDVTAQQYRLDYVRDTNPWLNTDNAATLTMLQIPHISEGKVAVTSEKGGFCNINTSESSFTFEADVESFYRIMPCMVGYGRMSYKNSTLHDVAGSTFITVHHMPFDIVEDSLVNEGDAHKDVYNIIGGLSYDVTKYLSLGAKVDFTAANYAKYKDLRHKNSLTDIMATAGIFMPFTSRIRVGANVFYHRTVEGVTYSIYGSEDRVYKSLIDYGILTGEVETFGENGYTEKNTEQPFVSEQKGFSIQFGYGNGNGKAVSWTNEFSYRSRKGYYGRDTSYDIVHNRHHGNIYSVNSTLSLSQHDTDNNGNHQHPTPITQHQLLFNLQIENLQNDANTYRTIQDKQTTAHYYEYYTPVKMSNKVWADYSIGYRGLLGITGAIPQWTLTTQYSHNQREQTVYYYPYSRHQRLSANTLSASVLRNITLRKGIIALNTGFAYRWGNGDIYNDILLATPSDKQREPDMMLDYQLRDYSCFTAPQYTAHLSIRYSLPLTQQRSPDHQIAPSLQGGLGRVFYIQLSGAMSHINGSASDYFNGSSRHSITIAVGACF